MKWRDGITIVFYCINPPPELLRVIIIWFVISIPVLSTSLLWPAELTPELLAFKADYSLCLSTRTSMFAKKAFMHA